MKRLSRKPDRWISRLRRRGAIAIYFVILMGGVIMGFASLGLDWAKVQLAKTQLQQAADAAVRAGVANLSNGVTATQNAAVLYAGYNTCNGTTVVLSTSTDIDFGTWNSSTKTFTVLTGAARSGATALRVWGRRTAATGNAIGLSFGALCGMTSCDVTVSSIATISSGQPTGFVGLSSFAIDKKLFAASYNSSVTTSPSHTNYNSNGILQSNGTIGQGSHAGCWLYGNTDVGPSGSVAGGINVTGTSTTLSSNITAPAVTMQVVTNPSSIPANETVSSNVTWPGGTYYFTSLTLDSSTSVTFSGPASVYVNGTLTMSGSSSITSYNSVPANLNVYQSSGNSLSASTSNTFIGVYDGPGCSVSFGNGALLEGAMIANNITLADNDDVYYDESLNASLGGSIQIAK